MFFLRSSLHIVALLTSFLAYIVIATTEGVFSAWITYLMGDSTAREEGYTSWNPLVHVDLFGVFSLLFLGIGWAKTVPIDPRNISNRLKLACAYFAGVFSCMVTGAIAAALLLKMFGMKFGSTLGRVTANYPVSLHQLSLQYPFHSSFSLALSLVLMDIVYFGIVLACINAILQGFRFVLMAYFPELFERVHQDMMLFFCIIVLSLLFMGPLYALVRVFVLVLGGLLAHALGAH